MYVSFILGDFWSFFGGEIEEFLLLCLADFRVQSSGFLGMPMATLLPSLLPLVAVALETCV